MTNETFTATNGLTDWDDGYYEGRHEAARIAEKGTLE